MALTPAERARRSRAHKRGDHSLCDPERCDGARDAAQAVISAVTETAVEAVTPPEVDEERQPGGIETAVTAFVTSLAFASSDPRAILGEVAVQLARRVDETGALPAAVRELRVLLAQLAEIPSQGPGPVDDMRAQRARRRLDQILANAS